MLILEAIEKRDAEAAKDAMRAHLAGAALRVGGLALQSMIADPSARLTSGLAVPKRTSRKTQLAGASK